MSGSLIKSSWNTPALQLLLQEPFRQWWLGSASVTYNESASGGLSLNGSAQPYSILDFAIGGGLSGGGSAVVSCVYNQREVINLIDNGYGETGDNTNFTTWTYDPVDKYQGGGSFRSESSTNKFSDDFIPVNAESRYVTGIWGKSGDLDGSNYSASATQLIGLACYDADYLNIGPHHVARYTGSTDTTLAVELKTGDTSMTLVDATGWSTNVNAYTRHLLWWPYTNSKGYTYPDYTYTRNWSGNNSGYNTNGLWAVGGISGNVITLTAPWPFATLPAGTPIRNATSGGTYNYCFGITTYTAVPQTWTRYSGLIVGTQTPWASAVYFRYGTEYVKFWARTNNAATSTNHIRWNLIEILWQLGPVASCGGSADVEFVEAPETQTYNETMSGGLKLAGQPQYGIIVNKVVLGGVIPSGSNTATLHTTPIPIGGAKITGTVLSTAIYNPVPNFGILVEGAGHIATIPGRVLVGTVVLQDRFAVETLLDPGWAMLVDMESGWDLEPELIVGWDMTTELQPRFTCIPSLWP